MDNKYFYSKIYKITNSIDDQIYIGSTIHTLKERFNGHKTASKRPKMLISQHMQKLGADNFQIVLVEAYPCNNKEQLEQREDYWIQELKPTLNQKFPTNHVSDSPVCEAIAWINTSNFKNAKIFKLYHESSREIFVGSTTLDLRQTFRVYYDSWKDEASQTPTLHNCMMRSGRNAFHIRLIQEYPCSSKEELLAREQFWIHKLKPELNEPIPDDAEPLPVNPRDEKDIIKSKYKNSKVFKIGNKVDDKIFVGSTIDKPMSCLVDHWVQSHDPMLELHRHLNKHGLNHFNIVILERFPCSSLSELQAVEAMWIKKLKPSLNYPVDPYWKYMQKLEKEKKYKS